MCMFSAPETPETPEPPPEPEKDPVLKEAEEDKDVKSRGISSLVIKRKPTSAASTPRKSGLQIGG